MLAKSIPDLEILAECEDGYQAVEQTLLHKPDLLFLDIQMPELDGFGVVQALHKQMEKLPEIIFVTAYDAHAVQAFEINAIDYLLKPVQKERLQSAVDRVRANRTAKQETGQDDRLEKLLEQLHATTQTKPFIRRIEIRSQGRIDYVPVEVIEWMEADGNYVTVHTKDQQHLARITMSELEETLDPKQFYRVSRKLMIRLNQVATLKSEGRRDHHIILKNGTEIPCSKSLQDLQEKLREAE
jgi:two-component system LytT family response regulator